MAHASENMLSRILFLDAATCFACGVLMTAGTAPLATLTSLPSELLRYAGASLFPIAAFMVFTAVRTPRSLPAVWLVIAGNVLWALASIALLLSAAVAPSALGYAFVVAQAAVVLLLTILELRCVGVGRATFARAGEAR
jgi:glucose uptake protein GlcU